MRPVLVIMAAGMGSRFGGLKQMTPVDDEGHVIIEYSMYDAFKAGFRDVVCIIKQEMQDDFESMIGHRVRNKLNLSYAIQSIDNLPKGYSVPQGRTKPWGTSHAVLSARQLVNAPFAVINADDYYGRDAYFTMFNFLSKDNAPNHHAMVSYLLKNTLSDNGTVSRGICQVDENNMITDIVERLKVDSRGYTEDDGLTFTSLAPDTPVSMNFFGFQSQFIDKLIERFPKFLDEGLANNPLKCEYLLPKTAGELIREGTDSMELLVSHDTWYGITYIQDLPLLKQQLQRLRAEGIYPKKLWQ